MTAEKFWLGWLKATVVFNVGMGVFMLIMSQLPFLCSMQKFAEFTTMLVEKDISCQEVRPLAGWLVSSTGIIMINWGIFLVYLAWYRVPKGDIQAIRIMIIALLAWFFLDTGFSIHYKAGYVILINVAVLFIWSAPLLSLHTIYMAKPRRVSFQNLDTE